jgi:serine/threonine protein kinase
MRPARPVTQMHLGGRFRLREGIAGGSMGEVWLADDEHLGSRVAVKFLRDHLVFDPWAVQRFFAEARIAAKLETRHVVRVLDFGTTGDGLPFVVMEYLDGETLAARLRRTPRLTPATALRILTPIARTLARAHALGVVHRDVKPENVFLALDDDGAATPKLIDFGVAKILGGDDAFSSCPSETLPSGELRPLDETDNRVLGTPPYMAPEQCGSIPDATPASDQWSFGVVAYECLTGAKPFPRMKRSEMYRVLQFGRFVPPSRVNPALPPELDRWMRIVLSVEPDLRFPSLLACVDALALALGSRASPHDPRARPVAPGSPPRGGSNASIAVAGMAFCGAVILAAVRATVPALPPTLTPAPAPIALAPTAPAPTPSCPVAATPSREDALAVQLPTGAPPHLSRAPRDLTASYRTDPY